MRIYSIYKNLYAINPKAFNLLTHSNRSSFFFTIQIQSKNNKTLIKKWGFNPHIIIYSEYFPIFSCTPYSDSIPKYITDGRSLK